MGGDWVDLRAGWRVTEKAALLDSVEATDWVVMTVVLLVHGAAGH